MLIESFSREYHHSRFNSPLPNPLLSSAQPTLSTLGNQTFNSPLMNQLLSSTQQTLSTLVNQTVQFSTTEPTAIISPTDFIDFSQSNVQFSTNEPTAIINPTDLIDSSQSNGKSPRSRCISMKISRRFPLQDNQEAATRLEIMRINEIIWSKDKM
ncbi:uncharacterized protein LOC113389729 [Ctenocephalides felis]|uniref:uncharacterized protein LOC113389729 n=1 Tax=Ctenocephalides felis TaxID=7515 RepID=UPI000E6E3D0B|nr:uncharacterized protein LOC113389729 [Ctenocephalides felis]